MATRKKKPQRIDDALREAIRTSELTCYRIAKDSGTTTDSVYRFLDRKRDLKFKTAADIAAAMGLELRPVEDPNRRTADWVE